MVVIWQGDGRLSIAQPRYAWGQGRVPICSRTSHETQGFGCCVEGRARHGMRKDRKPMASCENTISQVGTPVAIRVPSTRYLAHAWQDDLASALDETFWKASGLCIWCQKTRGSPDNCNRPHRSGCSHSETRRTRAIGSLGNETLTSAGFSKCRWVTHCCETGRRPILLEQIRPGQGFDDCSVVGRDRPVECQGRGRLEAR